AAGDDVLPVFAAALRDRHDVIEGQVAGRKQVAAVLARVLVARVDVGARERHVVEAALDLDIAEQPDDRRQLEREGHGADFAVVLAYNLDLPLTEQRDRLLPVDDLQRLVRSVEQKGLLHRVRKFCPTAVEVSRRVRARTALFRCVYRRLWYPRAGTDRRIVKQIGLIVFVAACSACASTGAVPRPFPTPGRSAPPSAPAPAPT